MEFDATPEVVELETATPEVVTPEAEAQAEQESQPEKIEQTPEENAKFAEQRRKHEAEVSDYKAQQEKLQAELEELRKQNEDLIPIKQKYDEEQRENALKQFAEANGLSYEEAVAIAQDEEEKETLKLENEALKKQLAEKDSKTTELESDLQFEKLYRADKESLRSIDPTIDIDSLGESYWKFRITGLTAPEALSALRAKDLLIEKAPIPGKIGKETPTSEMTEEEFDNMTDAQQKAWIKKDPAKAWEIQKGWFNK